MLTPLVLLGCNAPSSPTVTAPAPEPESPRTESGRLKGKNYRMAFDNLEITDAHLTATEPSVTRNVLVSFDTLPLTYRPIYRRGDAGFGDRTSAKGNPIEPVCNNQDYNALFEAKGAVWLASHFECTPGELFVTRLKQDDEGLLTPEFNKPIDFAAQGGLWNPCAGVITPWGTLLGGEEYEPNAAKEPKSLAEDSWDYQSWTQMKELYFEGETPNPYKYGWLPEMGLLTADGDAITAKHKAPGRFSHEIAYVMPDQRTVYLTDDGRSGGLFLFVSDEKSNLSAGRLYAARFNQTSTDIGGAGNLTWIPMGAADDAYIDALIANNVRFDELFALEKETAPGKCSEGFIRIRADDRTECLKLQPDSERVPNVAIAASRLETRRYAAYLGATTEFEKGEGLAYDPEQQILYMAFASISGRMKAEEGGVNDHIRLPENNCGAVWSGSLEIDQRDLLGSRIPSDLVLTKFSSLVAGTPIEADARGNTCAETGLANPDNLSFLPYYRQLMIAEDTSRHAVASLWALDTQRSAMKRVMVAPPGGEITGITWAPNLGGHGYLTVAIQHPWRAETLEDQGLPPGITEDDRRSFTGYLGPFPALD